MYYNSYAISWTTAVYAEILLNCLNTPLFWEKSLKYSIEFKPQKLILIRLITVAVFPGIVYRPHQAMKTTLFCETLRVVRHNNGSVTSMQLTLLGLYP